MDDTKYIFITGGVVSGLGKGITAASLGRLLKQRGLKVALQKLDPYLNVDPGTMSPYQHGEVFVTDDGAETDLDLGHYERFTDEDLTVNSSVTSGKIYWNVLTRERAGDYLGGTVQIIPHITNEIKARIYGMARTGADVIITEIGGTVGDIESQAFLEAIRQIRGDLGRDRVLYIHVPLVVQIPGSDELKTKPTQHTVKELRAIGIQPDILVCRSDCRMGRDMVEKISLFCNVDTDCVIQNLTVDTLYQAPVSLHQEGLDDAVCRKLGLNLPEPDMAHWMEMLSRIRSLSRTVRIGLVGKYVSLHDAYLSVAEALRHGGFECDTAVEIQWIDSEEVTDENAAEKLADCDGILVPGGFGDRGIEGKIAAVRYAREQGVPFFGICLGMQMAVVEFARHVANMPGAHSTEFRPDGKFPVIDLMASQIGITDKGGTMRLGAYPCHIPDQNTNMYKAYGDADISERHRHRWEFNNRYREELEAAGLRITGTSPDGMLVETVELPEHPWFVGVQFHPEFKSRPDRAHPLFREFVRAAGAQKLASGRSDG
jgi:CTP synthase